MSMPISLNSAEVSLHIKLCLTEQRRGPNPGGWPSSLHGIEGTQNQVDLCYIPNINSTLNITKMQSLCSFLLVIMWTLEMMSELRCQGDTTSAIRRYTGQDFVIVTFLLRLFPSLLSKAS